MAVFVFSIVAIGSHFSFYAEAVDFRNWCEGECARLIGTKGT